MAKTTKSATNPSADSQPTGDSAAQDLASQPLPETAAIPDSPADNSSLATELTTKITELTNDLQRTRADFENYRKQVENQKAQSLASGKYATIEKILPLIDDFSRALDSYPEQLQPLRKNFDKTLSSLNLARIVSDVDTEFNPDFHDAISVEDAGGEREVIAETLRPGYLYEGVVIRPAMVKVKRV